LKLINMCVCIVVSLRKRLIEIPRIMFKLPSKNQVNLALGKSAGLCAQCDQSFFCKRRTFLEIAYVLYIQLSVGNSNLGNTYYLVVHTIFGQI
jgi:hypothetical protein